MARAITRAVIASTAGVAAAMAASPASASVPAEDPIQIMASSRCLVGTSGNCTTAVIGAHPTGHFVDYVVNNIGRWSPCSWAVRDVNSRVVVRSGTVGVNNRVSGFVPGLYGFYQLELRGCTVSAAGILDND